MKNEQIVVNDWMYDLKYLCELMDKYKDTKEPFYGENQNGEDIEVHIVEDNICLVTYQSNGWIRKNYYHRDGTVEELFDGKWKRAGQVV